MSRRKQARPRLLKREGEDDEVLSPGGEESDGGQHNKQESMYDSNLSKTNGKETVAMDTTTSTDLKSSVSSDLHCDICDAKFKSLDQFMDHRNFECMSGQWTIDNLAAKMSQLEDPPISPESCDQSPPESDSPASAEAEHLTQDDLQGSVGVSDSNPYGCQFCDQAFPRLRYLKIHEQVHSDQLPFVCEHCSRRFRHKRSLDRHVKLHNGEKRYRCDECNAAFVRSDHLKAHQKTHTGSDDKLTCILCGKSVASMAMLTAHMVTHDKNGDTNTQLHTCQKREQIFESHSGLQNHLNLHKTDPISSKQSFHCTFCTEVCFGEDALEIHIQDKHTHRCPFCPYITSTADDLTGHLKLHDQFNSQNDVVMVDSNESHKSVPTPSKDLLVCPYCFCSDFSSLEVLEVHMQGVHNVKPAEVYTCNYCNAPYKNLYSLHEHMRAVHQNQPSLDIKYPCSLCGRQFGSIETLVQHKRALHPDEHRRTSTEYMKHLSRRPSRSKEHAQIKINTPKYPDESRTMKRPSEVKESFTKSKSPQQESIKCEYCNATFYDLSTFQTHMSRHMDQVFWCKLCNQRLGSEEQLESHVTSHYLRKTTQYGCTCCMKMFGKPDELQKHLMDIHAHHLYRCTLCKEIFDSKVNIQVHFAVKHSNECQLFQCAGCDNVFRSEMEYQVHVRVTHLQVSKPYRCLFCKDSFSSEIDLQCHLTTHNKPLKCPMCDEAFNVEYLLDKHMQEVHVKVNGDTTTRISPVKVKEENDILRVDVQSSDTGRSSGPGLSSALSPSKWSFSPGATLNSWAVVGREGKSPWKSPVGHSPGLWKHSPSTSPSLWKTTELLHTCNICDVKFFHQSALQMHKAVDHRLMDRTHCLSQSPGASAIDTVDDEIKIPPLDDLAQPVNTLKGRPSSSVSVPIETSTSPSSTSMELPVVVVGEKLSSPFLLSCMYCSQTFKNRPDLDKHVKIHLNSGSQKCNICDKIFATPGILAEHKLTHCKIQQGNMCVHCKIPLKSEEEFYLHSREHGGQNSYMQCLVCRQTLVSLAELQMHGKHHFQTRSGFFSCCICHKTFDSKENLISKENIDDNVYYVCKPCYHGEQEEYVCSQCNARFLTALQLEAHSETHKSYQCIKCQESFSSEQDIKLHVASHVMKEGNIHECKLCAKVFESPAKLQCHLIEHTFKNNNFCCSICGRVFETAAEIQQHAVEHGPGSRRYACKQCNQNFFFSAELENHKFCHREGSTSQSLINIKTEKSSTPNSANSLLKLALSSTSLELPPIFNTSVATVKSESTDGVETDAKPDSDGEYKCPECSKTFSTILNLRNHMKLHEKREQSYKCSLCSQVLDSLTALQKHFFNEHSNTELDDTKKVFRCPECSEEFPCQSNFQGHMRTHNTGSKFQCPHCPKVFALSRNLTIHMRSHNGDKPYECPICHKRFARKENRKAHLRSHGGIKPFLCPMCGKSFSRKCHVKEHMKCHFSQENSGEIDEASILEVDVNNDNASGADDVMSEDAEMEGNFETKTDVIDSLMDGHTDTTEES